MTSNEASGSSLPTSVSGHITSSRRYLHVRPHFAAQLIRREREKRKLPCLLVCLFFVVVMIVHNQFLPLALNQLTTGRLFKKVNKPAKNLRVPAKV